MSGIILTEEQARLLSSLDGVEICDPTGRVLVIIPPPMSAEEISRIKRTSGPNTPGVSGEQVRKGLEALDDAWQREGPFDIERARQIVRQSRET